MSKRYLQRYSAIVLAILFVAAHSLNAGKPTSGHRGPDVLLKTNTNDNYSYLDINNIFNMFSNNGDGSQNNFTATSGLEWPKGTSKTAIFEDGFLFGGYLSKDNKLYVDGSAYRHCWEAGPIVTPGPNPVKATPTDSSYRVYRVRPDVNLLTPLDENMKQVLKNENDLISRYDLTSSVQKIYDQYVKDWKQWPVADGAPYLDVNGNGKYDATFIDLNGNGVYDSVVVGEKKVAWVDVDNNGKFDPAIDTYIDLPPDVPGIPGADQTLWHVSNDLDKSLANSTYGSDPVGIEMQRTIWAYNRFGPLGNAYFTKYKLINKSGYAMDTMYVSVWSDPDLGEAGDDFVGCDTTLSLGFVYNGKSTDLVYGSNPPASGYDFFQGPVVLSPGDTATYNFNPKPGYKNLPMSSFNFFINGNAIYTDPDQGLISGTTQWYNLMRGLITTTGAPNIDPVTGLATKFAFYGDPVSKQGWVDGKISGGGKVQVIPPGDRRLSMTAGPFTMANGDTQEVVVATLVAQASDNLRSVSLLKYYDQIVQSAYANNFDLTPPPVAPNVKVTELNEQVVLDWGDAVSAAATESQNFKGYKFEGYNVYQLRSNSFSDANLTRLAVYDLDDGLGYINDIIYDDATGVNVVKPVQFGTNTGINRQYITKVDGFSGSPLVNGRSYFYAVTAYNYNPKGVPKSLESAPVILEIIPQSDKPGSRYASSADDVLPVTHTGISEGSISPIVIDPSRLTGDIYKVWFDTLLNHTTGKIGIAWSLADSTQGKTYVNKRSTQSVKDFSVPGLDNDYYTFDGVQVKVITVQTQSKDIQPAISLVNKTGALGRWTSNGGAVDSLKLEGMTGAIGNAYDHWVSGSTAQDRLRSVVIVFTNTNNIGNFDPNDPNVSYGYRYLFNADKRIQPGFGPFIINKAPGLPFQDFTKSVPFAAYDVESNPHRRLAVGFTENNQRFGAVNGKYWPPVYSASSTINNIGPTGPLEWFFIFDADYKTTIDSSLAVNMVQQSTPLMWVGTPARGDDNGWIGGANGDSLLIVRAIGNGRPDVFTFKTGVPTMSNETAKLDADKINVFPNPYFGFNKQELNKYGRFVTINHLPRRATIRVFNLAGVLLKTIEKDDDTQFARWDLRNQAQLPAAAGMYVIYIDMPDLGKTKVLKLAIIPEAQFLDKY